MPSSPANTAMLPPAPAITYTLPATWRTTTLIFEVSVRSVILLLKPRTSGMGPPDGILCAGKTTLHATTTPSPAIKKRLIHPLPRLLQWTDFVAATFVVGFSSTRYAWYITLPRFSIEWDG